MDVKIESSWKNALQEEFEKPYFQSLADFVREEYREKTIFPPAKYIFHAFDKCPFDRVKVVILGQDPYHGPNQAHGLAFSVTEGVQNPPSLQNIFKEIAQDLNKPIPASGNLNRWASQGVLLLNATLTVRAGQAGSHQKKGWEQFTDSVIASLSDNKDHLVFLLWGNYAKKKGEIINRSKHLVLEAPHPSPLSAHQGFFGCRHFSQTNTYLLLNGEEEIDW